MKKLKTTIITALLLIATVSAMAQEKYEYATLRAGLTDVVFITAENQEVTVTKLKENEKETIKKLNELSDKGWEVYNATFDASIAVTVYFLRKKKS